MIRFGGGLDEARAALTQTEAMLRDRFAGCGRTVLAYLSAQAGAIDETRWGAQIATFPEVLWCAVAREPGEDDAPLAARAAAIWEARRQLRDRVRLAPGEAGVFGCTMCGRREAAVPDPGAIERLTTRLPRDFRPSERLCAVCLVVRFAFAAGCFGKADGFGVPSVATVAAGPWLPKAATALEGSEAFADFVVAVDEIRWREPHPNPLRGQHEHRDLVSLLDAIYGVDPPEPPPKASKAAFQGWIDIVQDCRRDLFKQAPLARPPARYALVAYDGDDMGAFFRSQAPREREEASGRIAGFALDVAPEVVESAGALGVLLYAGGDDGRFLAPLDRVLRVVRDLRAAFARAMSGVGGGRAFTLSAGVAVADVHHPLDLVVEAANRGLEVAKHEYGKDAFCVVWLTGDGERLAGGRFGSGSGDVIADLDVVEGEFRATLSRSFASTLEGLARQLEDGVPPAVFADLARERLIDSGPTPAVGVIEGWLGTLPPRRAAGLVRLARDLAGVEV